MISAEIFQPYKRWLLSKDFLRDKTPQIKKLALLDERWYNSHKIETRLDTVVTQFNIDRRLAVLGQDRAGPRERGENGAGDRGEQDAPRSANRHEGTPGGLGSTATAVRRIE